jgi:hypothetical protein
MKETFEGRMTATKNKLREALDKEEYYCVFLYKDNRTGQNIIRAISSSSFNKMNEKADLQGFIYYSTPR